MVYGLHYGILYDVRLSFHSYQLYDDSICRDSGKLVSLYDNILFIFKCFMSYKTPS